MPTLAYMQTNVDVLIIGGGLAGLAAAIHLSQKGKVVTVVEKSAYPRHKVCGEYISNEIIPYLESLGMDVTLLHPARINQFHFSTQRGTSATAPLPLGGFGISRYVLDAFMYEKAIASGCQMVEDTVTQIAFANDRFTVGTATQEFSAGVVLGAYGKRSNVDQVLSREFIRKKSPWLAVKAHYSGDFPNNVVALHNFSGGYCGVSNVENKTINICYLAHYSSFKKYKNIAQYQREVLCKNPQLKRILESSTPLFEKPLTISQISFDKKQPVADHILMIGDTAGLIHPLCGNGMAMALHSAQIVATLVLDFYSGAITSRTLLEHSYRREWQKHFGKRLRTGRMLAGILRNKTITNLLLPLLVRFPALLPKIIQQTHGKPIILTS